MCVCVCVRAQTETVRTAAVVRVALSAQLCGHCSTSVNKDQWDHCVNQHQSLCIPIYTAVKDMLHDGMWFHVGSVVCNWLYQVTVLGSRHGLLIYSVWLWLISSVTSKSGLIWSILASQANIVSISSGENNTKYCILFLNWKASSCVC